MYDLMIYSLKVGVCLAVFYLFFKLLLSRETFHRFNRIVVLGAMVLSFVLPLCVITVYREIPVLPEFESEETLTEAVAEPLPETAVEPLPEPFAWETLAGAAFLVGAVATLAWTLCSLCGVLRLIRRGRRERLEDGTVLVLIDGAVTPFSWGRYIVMSETDLAENGGPILLHERAHLRLRHSADLIVTDLAGCLQWFNPAMWLLRRELRAIHEYEADEAVLDSGVDAKSYQLLLIRKAAGGRWYSVANSFNHSKLKNRITMMLSKKSSRWAGARALLLLPLTGLALGAFAQTAYVVPEDKVIKENVTIRVEGRKINRDGKKPLILVEGREVMSLDSINPAQIASISVLKDSSSRVVYGERGKDGVIVVTMKKTDGAVGDTVRIEGLKGRAVKITTADDDNAVRVIGYGTKPENGTVAVNTTGIVKTLRTKDGSTAGQKLAYIVDGVLVHEIESLDLHRIESMTVLKDDSTPEPYKSGGFDGVVKITTRSISEVRKSAVKAAEEGMKAGKAGIERARMELEKARKYMDSDTWKQAQKALEEAREYLNSDAWKQAQAALAQAQEDIESTREENSERLSAAQKSVGISPNTLSADAGHADEVKARGDGESSVAVYKGRVTLSRELPDGMLIYINGKEATRKDVAKLGKGKIRRMDIYKGDEAVKRYGEAGRNGVVEILARR